MAAGVVTAEVIAGVDAASGTIAGVQVTAKTGWHDKNKREPL